MRKCCEKNVFNKGGGLDKKGVEKNKWGRERGGRFDPQRNYVCQYTKVIK